MEICYHLGPGIWAVRRISRGLSPLSESRSRPQFFPGLVVLSGKPLDPPFTHGVQETGRRLAVLSMHHYGWRILYPLALNVYWWGWGRGGRAVKTVCMSIVFCRASDGVGCYLYYVFYVRVKLNSWHRNIEALFKKNGTFIWIFLLLILTDVLLWVLC